MSQWRWNTNGSQGNGAAGNGGTAARDLSREPYKPQETQVAAIGVSRDHDDVTMWLHQRLVRQLDPAAISDAAGRKSREAVEAAARALLAVEAPEITGETKEEVLGIVVDEIVGFGPID